MKILHLSSSLSRRAGGIFEIELAIAQHQQCLGAEVVALGLADSEWPADVSRWCPVPASVCPIRGPRSFGYAPTLLAEVFNARADLIHLHYMWMYPSVAVTRWAAETHKPYLVTPNGMLEPWALRNSAWKKKIAGMLYENQMLRRAACLQANTAKEAADFRAYGLKNPIAMIPNGVDLASFANPPSRTVLESRFPALKGKRWMLFLSRIHPKKGLPHLLRAWQSVVSSPLSSSLGSDWALVIAGPDELGHEAEMKQLATDLGIPWADAREAPPSPPRPGRGQGEVSSSQPSTLNPQPSLLFTGPLHGEEKMAALAGAELFVLPSFSEGFSMAVLEAAAAGLPVMLTPQCNFPGLAQGGGAIEVSPDAAGCEAGLRQLLALTDAERRAMGQCGRELVSRSYTWARIADQMLAVYRWLLGTGPKPDCVTTS